MDTEKLDELWRTWENLVSRMAEFKPYSDVLRSGSTQFIILRNAKSTLDWADQHAVGVSNLLEAIKKEIEEKMKKP